MKKFDVVIIGGGASGSVLAIMLAKIKKQVCVIDCNEFPAKKLLVTGNGRCNITNTKIDSSYYNQNIDSFLNKFNSKQTIEFFESIGLYTYVDNENRCYPLSNTAKSVVHSIKNQFNKFGITYVIDQVINVTKENKFVISTFNNKFIANKVVVATGNSNINFLSDFQIECESISPSLVALKTKQNTKRLQGLRLSDVSVIAYCNNISKKQTGEILFKQNGLSGICIFNLSTLFARNKLFNGKILIDIFPNQTNLQLENMIYKNKIIYCNAIDLLQGILHKEIGMEVLKRVDISSDVLNSQISDEKIRHIANTIKNLDFDVVGAYDNNQVVSGGVKLNCLTQNLEHKKYKGLYFCGEVCDIDAECGGYNLQWAFSSANAVCKGIEKNKD